MLEIGLIAAIATAFAIAFARRWHQRDAEFAAEDDLVDLPCPWCKAQTREEDLVCPGCYQPFGARSS